MDSIFMMAACRKTFILYLKTCFVTAYLLVTGFLCGCDAKVETPQPLDQYPNIFPDYKDVTIPVNIAPLNFMMQDRCEKIEVYFVQNDRILLKYKGKNKINIPVAAWSKMMSQMSGSSFQVRVFAKQAGKWSVYLPFTVNVAPDSIDPYVVYRLIEPGYEIWDKMGIYQRNLSDFSQSPIFHNQLVGHVCINCHSFQDYNPERMMFHSRGERYSGTFLLADDRQQRVNTKTEHAPSAGSHSVWHPSGDYIAFSSNTTRQVFHALPGQRLEVYDLESDLVVWDIKNNTMLRDARFTTADEWETFPAWSPDGKWLYYCCATAQNLPFEINQLKYGLYRVSFDAATGRFGNRVDTLLHPEKTGKSVSFPRISPDGRYLLYTSTEHGTFPIMYVGADLEMLELADNMPVNIQNINSNEADSYHTWSSNGRWIVFSSRRIGGLYTRLFFAYFDASGQIHKPFLLPQKNPEEDIRLLKSYNVPELIKGKVELNPYEISRTLDGEMTQISEIIPNKN